MTEQNSWIDELFEPPLEHEERARRFIEEVDKLDESDIPGYIHPWTLDDSDEGFYRISEELKKTNPVKASVLSDLADDIKQETKTHSNVSVGYYEFPSQLQLDEAKTIVSELAYQFRGTLHLPTEEEEEARKKAQETYERGEKRSGTFYSSLSVYSDKESYDFY